MPTTKMLFALFAAFAASACGVDDADPATSRAERDAALRDSAFGGLVEPMDRAKALQELQLERKRELDAAIEN